MADKNRTNTYLVDSGLFMSAADISQIFDKIFKKCITLSSRSVVDLINGLYGTEFPLDSKVEYNWTEFVGDDEKLSRYLADTIITINGEFSYHLEAQAYNENEIILRVFQYGYNHAYRTKKVDRGRCVLRFPKPVIIYLYYENKVPDEYVLELESESGEKLGEYKVPVVKLPEISAEEMNRRHMVILIPFHLLKLRYWIKDKKMMKSQEELKSLVDNDIIGSIDKNCELGNITTVDAAKLKSYTRMLCEYLYANTDAEGMEVLLEMTDHSFMTEVDILCEKLEEADRRAEEADRKREEADKKADELQRDKDELQRDNIELLQQLKEYKKLFGEL